MSRSRKPALTMPALLAHVIRAVDADRRRDAGRWSGNHSAALNDLARLFAVVVPTRGVLAPEDDLRDLIDRIATRHLQRASADDQLRAAMAGIGGVAERDAVESAHVKVMDVSEVAHYYAGLAAGLTLAGLGAGPWVQR